MGGERRRYVSESQVCQLIPPCYIIVKLIRSKKPQASVAIIYPLPSEITHILYVHTILVFSGESCIMFPFIYSSDNSKVAYLRILSKIHARREILIHPVNTLWHVCILKKVPSPSKLPNCNARLWYYGRHLKVFQSSSLGLPSYQAIECLTAPTLFLCLVQHEPNVCICAQRQRLAAKHYKGRRINTC